MNICGIVCEYNPFHNGHMHHIAETKKHNIDGIVCIMSGNYVQRADFAIMRKRARAEAAVHCGADLVIELPLPWSIASAERFAYGSISIINSLGNISHLSFGTETADISLLLRVAGILVSGELDKVILDEYSNGISFAKARERALSKVDKNLSSAIRSPNNILAVEYLKALIRLKSDIRPIAIPRHGAAHDENSVSDNIASASLIRNKISTDADISNLIPAASFDICTREKQNGNAPVLIKNADRAILSALKRLTAQDFSKYGDVSEGLEFRLFDAVSKSTSLDEVIDRAKTKRYAHSRIRRIILNAFLGIESHYSLDSVPYARVLAFNDIGRKIIKSAKKTSSIPIITRPSSIKNSESEKAIKLLALEKRADDIYSLFMQNPIAQGSTLTDSPMYITDKG